MNKKTILVMSMALIALFAISAFAYKERRKNLNFYEERHNAMTEAIESGDLETIESIHNNRPRKGCQGGCRGTGMGYHGMHKGENRGDNFIDENEDGICDNIQ